MFHTVRRNVVERRVKTQLKLLVLPEEALDEGPVDDPPVRRDGVEVEIVVNVVRSPPHPPHNVPVLAINCVGLTEIIKSVRS